MAPSTDDMEGWNKTVRKGKIKKGSRVQGLPATHPTRLGYCLAYSLGGLPKRALKLFRKYSGSLNPTM